MNISTANNSKVGQYALNITGSYGTVINSSYINVLIKDICTGFTILPASIPNFNYDISEGVE